MRSYLNILIFILLMSSCSEDEEITYGVSEPEIDQNTGTSDNYVKDILKEKNYDKWFTVHQPLLEDQTVENAIENASKLFLEYKF